MLAPRSTVLTPSAMLLRRRRGPNLPGTYYDWTGATLPAPWDTLRRAGLGTRVQADGALGYGAHNLLPQSTDPTASPWATGFGAGVGTLGNQAPGPDASSPLARVTSLGSDGALFQIFASIPASTVANCSAFVRQGTSTASALAVFNTVQGVTVKLTFNWASGAPSTAVSTGVSNVQYQDVGGGLYRVSFDFTSGNVGDSWPLIIPDTTAAGGTLLVGAAQISLSAGVRQYVPTDAAPVYLPRPTHDPSTLAALGVLVEGQATNLCSTSFANWMPSEVTRSYNAGIAPDGSNSAVKLIPSTVSTVHDIRHTAAISVTVGQQVTYTVYLKPAEYSVVAVWVNTESKGLYINATTGIVISETAGITIRENYLRADGWRVVTYTYTADYAGPVPGFYCCDNAGNLVFAGNGADGIFVWEPDFVQGAFPSSHIPKPGTGTAVRTGDFAGGGISGAALTALLTPTAPFTIILPFRKANNAASVETLLGLCAGASAGTTNQLGIATQGTQAQIVHSGGSGALTGTLVLDGSTVNRVAVSVDPANARASISVNGSTPVETTGIAYTGAGTTALILGARDSSGGQPATAITSPGIRVVPGQYITGSALQALSQ